MFGPPQTVSEKPGGLNTAIGYRWHEDKFKSHTDYIFKQNQVYSQVSYGAQNIWEIYGRVGIADLKIADAFRSANTSTIASKKDMEENWKFFCTLGAKAFYPFNNIFGIGAFIQGTYNFSNFTDESTIRSNGITYLADLKIENLWDVNFGAALQATVPLGIKLYLGPYISYSEAKASLSKDLPGIEWGKAKILMQNKSRAGGFAGADIPLAKGFRMNVEGQYAKRLSFGAAITYAY